LFAPGCFVSERNFQLFEITGCTKSLIEVFFF